MLPTDPPTVSSMDSPTAPYQPQGGDGSMQMQPQVQQMQMQQQPMQGYPPGGNPQQQYEQPYPPQQGYQPLPGVHPGAQQQYMMPGAVPAYYPQQYPQPYPQQYPQPMHQPQMMTPGAGNVQVVVVNSHDHEKHTHNSMAPIIIFIVGWFCCPVWCVGWAYLNKRHSTTGRIFGGLSVSCAIINTIWIAIVIGVFASTAAHAASTLSNCSYKAAPSPPTYSYSSSYYSPTRPSAPTYSYSSSYYTSPSAPTYSYSYSYVSSYYYSCY
jgi:hypothetical protein